MSEPAHQDVLAALRHATAQQHALLDGGLAIASAGATLRHYQQHLQMLLAWITPLEAWLATFSDGPQAHPALPPKPRAALIAHDLQHPCMPPALPMKQAAAPWPAHASPAYRWGVCYVVEGSQLGGAVLYQRLKAQLAPHPLDYLRGEAEGPGARWRAFMLAVREQVRGDADIAEACQGALDAFDHILALRPLMQS